MPSLIRRKLRCHYCNAYSQNDQGGIPRTWLCPYCEAVNHLDERGDITDPPAQVTAAPQLQFARSRSPTPMPSESPFCDTCQRNQLLLNKTLAEYIPDEDDPDYDKYASTVDEYRAELEERYPQVCDNCIDRVQEQIRAAGYAAKADHLRRVLDQSRKHKTDAYTPRQLWTLAAIWIAKWTYVVSVIVGLIWHSFGMLVYPRHQIFVEEEGNLLQCFNEAVHEWSVDQTCVHSSSILQLAWYAFYADILTLWWNPKLQKKTNRPGGRMRGLFFVWFLRISTLASRYFGLRALTKLGYNEDDLRYFHYTHGVLFTILLLSAITGWKSVRITYISTQSLMQPLDAHLPSAPHSAEKPKSKAHTTARPNNSSFDTMAQSFTSSFPIGKLAEPSTVYPPSPTLTTVSSISQDSETATPYQRKTSTRGADDMDWTPTQKRFADQTPSVLPSQWTQSSPPRAQPIREPISLFSKPDPNPFRHKIPAAPKAPAASKADPWKKGVWAPQLKESTPNFFKESKKGKDDGMGLQGVGVPRNVTRDAELFDAPRLKYDHYGRMKETGLESSFNDLFSK